MSSGLQMESSCKCGSCEHWSSAGGARTDAGKHVPACHGKSSNKCEENGVGLRGCRAGAPCRSYSSNYHLSVLYLHLLISLVFQCPLTDESFNGCHSSIVVAIFRKPFYMFKARTQFLGLCMHQCCSASPRFMGCEYPVLGYLECM